MATIEMRTTKAGKTHYRVDVHLKGQPRARATFHRLTDARKWAAQTEAAIREGRYFKSAEAKRHTLSEAIDRYIAEVLPRKPKSIKKQSAQLEWWRGQLGDLVLADVTAPRIAEARSALQDADGKAASSATVNRYCAVLSHLFSVAQREWHWAQDSPFTEVARLKEPTGRVRCLSKDVELPALLKACAKHPDPNVYDAVILALSTGARKGEILGLRWPDVDFERGQLTLRDTKNGETRAVPLTGHARERMEARARLRRFDCNYVFPCKSKPVPADIDRPFSEARDKAGIEDFRFHDLRHSAASYLAMSGASLAELAAVLGHKTLAMVKRYSHIGEQHTAAIVRRMNETLFEGVESVKGEGGANE